MRYLNDFSSIKLNLIINKALVLINLDDERLNPGLIILMHKVFLLFINAILLVSGSAIFDESLINIDEQIFDELWNSHIDVRNENFDTDESILDSSTYNYEKSDPDPETETENISNAVKIFDPSSVPVQLEKYLCFLSRRRIIATKLQEIFNLQFPNKRLSLRKYDVINWPEGVYMFKDHWDDQELGKINEKLPFLQFVRRPVTISIEKEFGIDNIPIPKEDYFDPELLQVNVLKLLFSRFKEETGLHSALRINWDLVDLSRMPKQYENVPINSRTITLVKIRSNREMIDNIHFKNVSGKRKSLLMEHEPVKRAKVESDESSGKSTHCSCDSRIGVKKRMLIVKSKLKEAFMEQKPFAKFNLRNENILNWPEGIDLFSHFWTHSEMDRIEDALTDLVFQSREKRFSYEEQLGIDHLGDLRDILVPDWDRKSTYHRLLIRYREETGEPDARFIKWDRLDRKAIPSKYDGIVINAKTMSMRNFFKNPEIVENIHFLR